MSRTLGAIGLQLALCGLALAVGFGLGQNHPDWLGAAPQGRHAATVAALAGLPAGAVVASSADHPSGSPRLYHRPDCGFARRIGPANRTVYPTTQAAAAAGCRPCSRCRP